MEIRKAQRRCQCKNCDKTIMPNTEDIVYFYSRLNRGTYVHICMDCVTLMNKMIDDRYS